MRSIDVRVRHDDDLVVTKLGDVEVVRADARAQSRDHRDNFGMREHLVVTSLFDVEDLSLDRKNRLGAPIAALLWQIRRPNRPPR